MQAARGRRRRRKPGQQRAAISSAAARARRAGERWADAGPQADDMHRRFDADKARAARRHLR